MGSVEKESPLVPSGISGSLGNGVLCPVSYRLQLQSPLPVLQWPQRQALDLQKQLPLGAAAFSAAVGAAGGGVVSQPVARTTAASIIRSFVIVPSVELSIRLSYTP